jgi:hypothetical protein
MTSAVVWNIVEKLLVYAVIQITFFILYFILFVQNHGEISDMGTLTPMKTITFTANAFLGAVFSFLFIMTNKDARKCWTRFFNQMLDDKNSDHNKAGDRDRFKISCSSLNCESNWINNETQMSHISGVSDLEAYKSDYIHRDSDKSEEDISEDYATVTNDVILSSEDSKRFLFRDSEKVGFPVNSTLTKEWGSNSSSVNKNRPQSNNSRHDDEMSFNGLSLASLAVSNPLAQIESNTDQIHNSFYVSNS